MKIIFQSIYILFPLLLIVGLIWGAERILTGWKYLNKVGKRSPIKNYKLWRNPGETLREQFENQRLIAALLIFTIPLSFFVYSPLYFSTLLAKLKGTFSISNFLFTVLCNLFLVGLGIHQMMKAWKKYHMLLLGYEAEVYVGQQLNHLMAVGCRVYHDFPLDSLGNIDHIVVSPVGIFAVETKGRAKPDKQRGSKDATVSYDGKTLFFPDGREDSRPLSQAKRNAQALSKWLASATGMQSMPVTPVVALAGWFVDYRIKSPEIKIYNGKLIDDSGQLDLNRLKKSCFFFAPANGATLDSEAFGRVVHQLDAKCRDVKPLAYKKESDGK